MQGPDPVLDTIQDEEPPGAFPDRSCCCRGCTDGRTVLLQNFKFNGTEGMAYPEFLQQIRRVAFSQGKTRDFAWMADIAALHFSGGALQWYESLDKDVQQDWDRLRQAIVGKYGDGNNETTVARETVPTPADPPPAPAPAPPPPAPAAAPPPPAPAPAPAPPPPAPAPPPPRPAPPPPAPAPVVERQNPDDYLLPARVEIVNWSTPSPWSKIRFPRSEGEWLDEARKRKSKFGDRPGAVRWHLVETWEEIPGNAIPTGNEGGTQIFSIRTWKDPCLAIGKHVRGNLFWSSTRAWIPWWGKELACSGPFEILVGDQSAVRWVSPREAGRFHAVEGGFETGDPGALLIGQFNHMGMQVPGKVFSAGDEGYFGWWQMEFRNRDFRVLAWN